MAPSIAARYITRRLFSSVKTLSQEARAANNVQNKETAMTASIGARYITRRQLSSGDILSQEANVHTMEAPPKIGEKGDGMMVAAGLVAYSGMVVWHYRMINRLEEKYGFKVETNIFDGTLSIRE